MPAILRPGFVASRRDATSLQVGLDRRAVLPDTPENRTALERLRLGLTVADLPTADEVVAVLREHDLVVESRDLRPGTHAVFAAYGADATRRLAARARASVAVRVLAPADEAWGAELSSLLGGCGVAARPTADDAATLTLLVSVGEPERELVDPWLVTGQPHLLVVLHEGTARIGPFVLPGATACLRCVDAHLDEHDGRRGLVLHQMAGTPSPVEATTRAAAFALAARDVIAYVDGDRPGTWSATLTLGPEPGVEARTWRRHPHCGCSWDELLDLV